MLKATLLTLSLLLVSGPCLAAGKTRSISKKAEFQENIKKGTVVVDFYAQWCGPCKNLAPIIDQLSDEMCDVTFIKVDTDASDFSQEYNVQSLPTIVIFKDGKKVKTVVGFKKKAELKKIIQNS